MTLKLKFSPAAHLLHCLSLLKNTVHVFLLVHSCSQLSVHHMHLGPLVSSSKWRCFANLQNAVLISLMERKICLLYLTWLNVKVQSCLLLAKAKVHASVKNTYYNFYIYLHQNYRHVAHAI